MSAFLLEKFNFVPVFLSEDIRNRFYYGFCKQYLWPLFHYMLPLSSEHGTRFDRALWQAYVHANRYFADKVMEVISPEDDFVWIHDYHLMVLPTFLRLVPVLILRLLSCWCRLDSFRVSFDWF